MAIDVRPEILIDRPRSEVAAYMFDPTHDTEWTSGVVACRPLTEGRLRAGAQVERTASFLGRRFTYRYEVIAAEGDAFVEMTVDKPFPMHIRYELEDAPPGTRARIQASGEPGGFFKIAAPLVAPMVRRNIQHDLEQLKQRLEARARV